MIAVLTLDDQPDMRGERMAEGQRLRFASVVPVVQTNQEKRVSFRQDR